MQRTRDTVQTLNEDLAPMPRTPAAPYLHTLAKGASTTIPQLRSSMEGRKGSHNDTFDLLYPAFLLLAVCAICVLIAGYSGKDHAHAGTISRPSHVARMEKTYQRKVVDRTRTRPIFAKLPVEVIEYIIDHLQGNNYALATCKLVHSTWLPRARMHLHRTLIIEKGGPDPFKLKFFPQVAQHVRELVVSHILLGEIASSVLVELDRVQSLQIISTSGIIVPALISATDFPRFTHLKELHVDGHCFSSQSALLHFVAKAQHISSLSIDLERPPSDIVAPIIGFQASLQEAVSRCASLELQTLRMRFRLTESGVLGPLPQTFLNIAQGTLRHATLINVLPGSLEMMFHTFRLMNFSVNFSLETFAVDFAWAPSLWYTGQTRQDNDARLATSFLSQFCDTRLRALSFRLVVCVDRDTLLSQLRHLHFGWLSAFVAPRLDDTPSMVDRERTRALAENLQSLRVEVRFSCKLRPNELDRMRRHVNAQLTDLMGRGILDLVVI